MKTIITIPILFSKTVPDRLIPLLCKLEERNIAVNYRKVFEDAIVINTQNILGTLKRYVKNENLNIDTSEKIFNENNTDLTDKIFEKNEIIDRIDKEIQRTQQNLEKELAKDFADQNQSQIAEWELEIERLNARRAIEREERDSLVHQNQALLRRKTELDRSDRDSLRDKEKAKLEKEKEKEKYEKEMRVKRKEEYEKKTKVDSSYTSIRTSSIDSVEVPPGVILYKDISLEPTIIEIGVGERKYFIGLKAIPYQIDTDSNIIRNMMIDAQGGVLNTIKRILKQYKNSILRHSFGRAKYIYKGRPIQGNTLSQIINALHSGKNIGDNPMEDIYFSPSVYELTNAKTLSRILESYSPVWSTILCTTTTDVEEAGVDLEYFYKIYRRATKVGWGDLLFIDREQEMVSHCSMSLLSCTKISFSSLQKLFNLENVIDFSQLSRYAKGPFSANTIPIKSFMKKGF